MLAGKGNEPREGLGKRIRKWRRYEEREGGIGIELRINT